MHRTPSPRVDPDRVLRELLEGTSTETGEAFFDLLVRHLARALDVRFAWVTELLEREQRLRALSFWVGDGYYQGYEYAIPGTPCEHVVQRRALCRYGDRVVDLFPNDPDLGPLGAVSYLGAPLLDTDGRVLGNLAVMDTAPIADDAEGLETVFRIFAARAAAELRRLRRDQTLTERGAQLVQLFNAAMDAVIEMNADLRPRQMNGAARRLLGGEDPPAPAPSIADALEPASHARLKRLMEELPRRPDGSRSVWIPNGLEVRHPPNRAVQADATLTCYQSGGETVFVLIARDVNERLEAERRISALTDETEYLKEEIAWLHGWSGLVGRSPALRNVLQAVEQVAHSDATVLLQGETGTGKELIARAIHERSPRSNRRLVRLNCAAIPSQLQESEFFGHQKGAFTGATEHRQGRFKLADGGTLFLDEVGELPLDLQAKLLRVLQEGEYEPVGGARTERVDVRVISATNRDLSAMVEDGRFRRDLWYRLNVFPIRLPPLRERGDDVALLAQSFLDNLAARLRKQPLVLDADGRARLQAYDWPGNVRELQNVIERAVILSPPGGPLRLRDALPGPPQPRPVSPPIAPAPSTEDTAHILTAAELRDIERRNIIRALQRCRGKIAGSSGAARLLGLPPSTLASRMKSLGIDRASTAPNPTRT